MSYYEDRIKHLEDLVATMAREQRMKAIPVEAKLVERIAEYEAENTRLKAEVDALKLGSLLTAVDVLQFINLKAEVERLRASSFVTAVPVEEYEKLKAEVERLRKATEWQTIDTAPAFPTKILFGGFFKPGWGEGFWWQHGYKAGALDIEATHWMPEPQPPSDKEGKPSV